MDYKKEERRRSVQRCLAILLTATNDPDELFMKALVFSSKVAPDAVKNLFPVSLSSSAPCCKRFS